MRRLMIAIFTLLCTTLSIGQDFYPEVGDVVPDFTFETIDGVTKSIQEYRGQTVLINLFGTRCPPCLAEMKDIKAVLTPKQKEGKFTILAIGVTDSDEELQAFRKKHQHNMTFVSDGTQNIFHLFARHTIPRNILVDRNGKIIFKSKKFLLKDFQEMTKIIDREINAH